MTMSNNKTQSGIQPPTAKPSIPDSYVDTMPCDPSLLAEIGRVTWAAARLHSGVRDAIDTHLGGSSMMPFTKTLGTAVRLLQKHAKENNHHEQVAWAEYIGMPAVNRRNAVVHGVTYTFVLGSVEEQAIGTLEEGNKLSRLLVPELRLVTRELIEASMALPK
ncbi:hypothetical protein KDH83_30080 [Achromobacter sp. Marseille-Q0513]|uniref:hypothetical protein n=1 Tax=Achromobacter sp. Marseille-Q0513 TaxID=2829161 RepID=UPI001B94A613|nr:hypothetical protein [Achromobacter sp. Marseille-Q0513]MBR8657572.1 hypothetical protein [Achromobacter sp. Marseille-Q0513]